MGLPACRSPGDTAAADDFVCGRFRVSQALIAMAALRLLAGAVRRAPSALVFRRGYAEAAETQKLKLSLVLPHQVNARSLGHGGGT